MKILNKVGFILGILEGVCGIIFFFQMLLTNSYDIPFIKGTLCMILAFQAFQLASIEGGDSNRKM